MYKSCMFHTEVFEVQFPVVIVSSSKLCTSIDGHSCSTVDSQIARLADLDQDHTVLPTGSGTQLVPWHHPCCPPANKRLLAQPLQCLPMICSGCVETKVYSHTYTHIHLQYRPVIMQLRNSNFDRLALKSMCLPASVHKRILFMHS